MDKNEELHQAMIAAQYETTEMSKIEACQHGFKRGVEAILLSAKKIAELEARIAKLELGLRAEVEQYDKQLTESTLTIARQSDEITALKDEIFDLNKHDIRSL